MSPYVQRWIGPSTVRETISARGWNVFACSINDEISNGRSCISPCMGGSRLDGTTISEIALQEGDQRFEIAPVRRAEQAEGVERCLVEDRLVLGERPEALLAVIRAESARANAAERQILLGKVPACIVDGDAARDRRMQHLVAPCLVLAEPVERK